MANSFLSNEVVIVHQNIRSLRENFDIFLSTCASPSVDILPHIILLSEIWVYNCEINNYTIDGYTTVASCNEQYRAGGVIAFIDNNIFSSSVVHCLECCDCLQVDVEVFGDKFSILCVYRLHSYSEAEFLNEFARFMANIKFKNLIIAGDININILEKTSGASDYLLLMACEGLFSLINEVTRPISESCIDHIFYRLNHLKKYDLTAKVLALDITDHSLLLLKIKPRAVHCNHNPKVITERYFTDVDILKNFLRSESWLSVLNNNNPAQAFTEFFTLLVGYVEKAKQKISNSGKQRKLKAWINEDILRLIEVKNKLYVKTLRNPRNVKLKNYYKTRCKKLKSAIRRTKENYYKCRFRNLNQESRKQWALINDLIGLSTKHKKVSNLRKQDGVIITDTIEISNSLNDHFINVAHTYRSTYQSASVNQKFSEETFAFYDITKEEICLTIDELRNTRSAGFDGLSNWIIKQISLEIVDVLCYLFNLCIKTGYFPIELKKAITIPVFKSGDANNPNNYRPISLLPAIAKIFEKIIKSRIVNFLDSMSFFNAAQFGFRRNSNTEMAILNFSNRIHSSINKGLNAAGLFIDLTKAFDLVDHQVLLQILWRAGFRGVSYDFFRSYLDHRTQRVKINDVLSEELLVTSGVPQGSVLGPLLFLIYSNSLLDLEFSGKITAFADDLAFSYEASSDQQLIEKMEDDLTKLRYWLEAHYMILSCKSNYIIFNLNEGLRLDYRLICHDRGCVGSCNSNCVKIPRVDSVKYLGVVLNDTLTFKTHVEKLNDKLQASIRTFYFLRRILSVDLCRTLYFALVQSRLEYCITAWGGIYYSNFKQLLITQKHFVRMILKRPRTAPSLPLFRRIGALPLRYLYIYKVIMMFYVRSGSVVYRPQYYSLRAGARVNIPKPRTENFRRYFLYIAPNLFNYLPTSIKDIDSETEFKKSLKRWILNHDEVEHLFVAIK